MSTQQHQPKLVLATLTAKYIHSSLALRYLREACRHLPVSIVVQEYHINMPPLTILSGIYRERPDIVGFSCYIWNITQTLELADMLKKVHPKCMIVLGGPEVSYDAVDLMKCNPAVDFVLTGEGEESLPRLVSAVLGLGEKRWAEAKNEINGPSKPVDAEENGGHPYLNTIPGLAFREAEGKIKSNPPALIDNLETIRPPYSEDGLKNLDNKLVYIETSRGCPFSCQYCLSSRSKGVRYFPLRRVEEEIRRLVERGCEQIKFVDRTFNCHKRRALHIWRFLRDLPGTSVFHFEIAADLLDEDMLQLLDTIPPGKFQFEIGVQTTTPQSLEAIERRQDWRRISSAVRRLTSRGNIEVHLDLIAGLPGDSYETFSQAVDDVYSLNPTRIQLGFLKVLKGSGLWQHSEELGLVYQRTPPYEILATPTMSYGDLAALKQIEELIEQFYNSHRFDYTIRLVIDRLYGRSAMAFLSDLSKFWEEMGLFAVSHKQAELYDLFARFLQNRHPEFTLGLEALVFDFAAREPRRDLPGFADSRRELKQASRQEYYQLLSSQDWRQRCLPHLVDLPSREVDKQIRIVSVALPEEPEQRETLQEECKPRWYLFDYSRAHPVTGRAAAAPIELEK